MLRPQLAVAGSLYRLIFFSSHCVLLIIREFPNTSHGIHTASGLVWFGSVWFGLVWCGLMCCGLVRFGLIWSELISFGGFVCLGAMILCSFYSGSKEFSARLYYNMYSLCKDHRTPVIPSPCLPIGASLDRQATAVRTRARRTLCVREEASFITMFFSLAATIATFQSLLSLIVAARPISLRPFVFIFLDVRPIDQRESGGDVHAGRINGEESTISVFEVR